MCNEIVQNVDQRGFQSRIPPQQLQQHLLDNLKYSNIHENYVTIPQPPSDKDVPKPIPKVKTLYAPVSNIRDQEHNDKLRKHLQQYPHFINVHPDGIRQSHWQTFIEPGLPDRWTYSSWILLMGYFQSRVQLDALTKILYDHDLIAVQSGWVFWSQNKTDEIMQWLRKHYSVDYYEYFDRDRVCTLAIHLQTKHKRYFPDGKDWYHITDYQTPHEHEHQHRHQRPPLISKQQQQMQYLQTVLNEILNEHPTIYCLDTPQLKSIKALYNAVWNTHAIVIPIKPFGYKSLHWNTDKFRSSNILMKEDVRKPSMAKHHMFFSNDTNYDVDDEKKNNNNDNNNNNNYDNNNNNNDNYNNYNNYNDNNYNNNNNNNNYHNNNYYSTQQPMTDVWTPKRQQNNNNNKPFTPSIASSSTMDTANILKQHADIQKNIVFKQYKMSLNMNQWASSFFTTTRRMVTVGFKQFHCQLVLCDYNLHKDDSKYTAIKDDDVDIQITHRNNQHTWSSCIHDVEAIYAERQKFHGVVISPWEMFHFVGDNPLPVIEKAQQYDKKQLDYHYARYHWCRDMIFRLCVIIVKESDRNDHPQFLELKPLYGRLEAFFKQLSDRNYQLIETPQQFLSEYHERHQKKKK